jgi:futalosine hydrolase
MYIIIAAATREELAPYLQWHAKLKNELPVEINILITGIGQIATTFNLTHSLSYRKPDLVIQAGIAGSFDNSIPVGSVVLVEEEVIGDWGAVEKGEWRDVFDIGLITRNAFPFYGGRLVNPGIQKLKLKNPNLPLVTGVTVNEMITTAERSSAVVSKYKAQIESMEGAALHYTCLQMNVMFIQLRAVSNPAMDRDKSRWKIDEAITRLNEVLITIIEQYVNETDARLFTVSQ